MPPEVERRILAKNETSKEAAVGESVLVCCEILQKILSEAGDCGVPLGISVESVSGFREEIDAAFELFRRLQQIFLDARGLPWGVRWFRVPLSSLHRSASEEQLARLEAQMQAAEAKEGSMAAQINAQIEPAGGGTTPSTIGGLAHSAALVVAGFALGLMIARLPGAGRH